MLGLAGFSTQGHCWIAILKQPAKPKIRKVVALRQNFALRKNFENSYEMISLTRHVSDTAHHNNVPRLHRPQPVFIPFFHRVILLSTALVPPLHRPKPPYMHFQPLPNRRWPSSAPWLPSALESRGLAALLELQPTKPIRVAGDLPVTSLLSLPSLPMLRFGRKGGTWIGF